MRTKSLKPVLVEWTFSGLLQLGAGMLFIAAAAAFVRHPRLDHVLVGGVTYAVVGAVVFRFWVARAVRAERQAPSDDCLGPRQALVRSLLVNCTLVALVAALDVLYGYEPMLGAVLTGFGVAALLTALWLHRFESAHHVRVLRDGWWGYDYYVSAAPTDQAHSRA